MIGAVQLASEPHRPGPIALPGSSCSIPGAFPPPFIPWRIRVCRTPLLGRWAVQGGNLVFLGRPEDGRARST